MMKQFCRNSMLIVLTVLLASSFTGFTAFAAGKDSVEPVQSVAVVDGNGKSVGGGLGLEGFSIATVVFGVNGEMVLVRVNHDRIGNVADDQPQLIFESANCVGPAFSPNPIPAPSLAPNHLLSNTLVYAYDPPTTTIIRSVNKANNGVNNCQTVGPFQATATPLRLLIDLATQFQPPFTMR